GRRRRGRTRTRLVLPDAGARREPDGKNRGDPKEALHGESVATGVVSRQTSPGPAVRCCSRRSESARPRIRLTGNFRNSKVAAMRSWNEVAAEAGDLADAGRTLLLNCAPAWGIALLGTLRANGSPRIGPLCVYILDDRLYVTVEGQKERDLQR